MSEARIEKHSPTWRYLLEWAEEQEQHAIDTIFSPHCAEDKAMLLRGRRQIIQELRLLGMTDV